LLTAAHRKNTNEERSMVPYLSQPPPPGHYARHARPANATITHVVVIIQENRTIDNLFHMFCVSATQCANAATNDQYLPGDPALTAVDLDYAFDPSHKHTQFVTDYAGGLMNGFPTPAPSGNPLNTTVAYVPASETPAYRFMFTYDGILNDNVFAANQGPSFPAHQYGIAGHAGGYDTINVSPQHLDIAENPQEDGPDTTCEGNGSGFGGPVNAVNLAQAYPGLPEIPSNSCRDHKTIFDLLPASLTWKYYSQGDQTPLWEPTQGIKHLFGSANFDSPNYHDGIIDVVKDIKSGNLANVVFVTPPKKFSDHPKDMQNNTDGGDWVGNIVNAIGGSQYWTNTVVIVYWDDFGGFFDHVKQPFAADPFLIGSGTNPNEYGFRLPYGVVSAYARVNFVAHGVFTSPAPLYCSTSDSLSFIEHTFGLGSLGTEDVLNTGCTASMIDLTKPAHIFQQVPLTNPPQARARLRK
jgi:phospholipase C